MDVVGVVTLPMRLGLRAASWGMRTAAGILPIGGGEPPAEPERREPSAEERPAPAATVVRPTPAPPEPEPAPEPQPAHVDEGATVVGEFAEEGVEDGAGAQVDLSEPWDGYDLLHADEVVEQLAGASDETLAAVALYERSTRERSSVIEAAEEQLRRRTAPGPA